MTEPVAYQALARKWRPQTFDEVVAQPQVTQALRNAIAAGRIHHAYLFCGPRGTGKTTTARILAKALNCETGPTPMPCNRCVPCLSITQGNCLDVLEIDAASHTQVEKVRDLLERLHFVPAGARFKIYIVDEVHRLSGSAFDALLKTLEEPPPSVKFIFATTEVHKVPPTVRSRALRFDFHLVGFGDLRMHLERVARAENIAIDPEALNVITAQAAGSVRDSQSLLDQVAAYAGGPITASLANEALGLVDAEVLFALTESFTAGDPARAVSTINDISRSGRDFEQFAAQLSEHLKRLLFACSLKDRFADDSLSPDQRSRYQSAAGALAENDLLRLLLMSVELEHRVRRGQPQPLLEMELFAMRAARLDRSVDIRALVDRLERQNAIPARAGETRLQSAPEPEPSAAATELQTQASHRAAPRPAQEPSEQTEPAVPARQQPLAVDGDGRVDFAPILESICRSRPTLRAVLGHAELVRTGTGTYALNVYHGSTFLQRQLADKPIRDLIHAEVTRALGAGVRVAMHVKEGPPSPHESSPQPQSAGQGKGGAEDLVRADHGVQEIMRRFDGEIVA